MGADDLDVLRDKLPELFDDKRIDGEIIEDSVVVPVDDPPEELDEWIDGLIESSTGLASDGYIPDWHSDNIMPPNDAQAGSSARQRDPLAKIGRGEFAGRYRPPTGWRPRQPIPPLAPDSLAFYLPFHYSRDYWGIYVVLEHYVVFCSWLYAQARSRIPGLTPATVRKAVNGFLYGHEHYHHKVECFSVRLEVVSRIPLYRRSFESLYKQRVSHPDSIEEGLATAAGILDAGERLKADPTAKAELQRLFASHVRLLPPEYQEGLKLLDSSIFEAREQEFSEANHGLCFPSLSRRKGRLPQLWGAFTFAYRGFIQINSPFSFIVPRTSSLWHRLPHSLRNLTARDVRRRIGALGECTLLRQGGRHEVWVCKKTGNEVQIPRHPGDLKRGTLASIAKEACGMNLHEFLQVRI